MATLEFRATKVYNRVCKFICKIGYSPSISVDIEYKGSIAFVYVKLSQTCNLNVSDIQKLLHNHFSAYKIYQNKEYSYVNLVVLRV